MKITTQEHNRVRRAIGYPIPRPYSQSLHEQMRVTKDELRPTLFRVACEVHGEPVPDWAVGSREWPGTPPGQVSESRNHTPPHPPHGGFNNMKTGKWYLIEYDNEIDAVQVIDEFDSFLASSEGLKQLRAPDVQANVQAVYGSCETEAIERARRLIEHGDW